MFLFDSGQHNRLEKRLRLGQKSAGGWGGRRPLVTRFRKEHRLLETKSGSGCAKDKEGDRRVGANGGGDHRSARKPTMQAKGRTNGIEKGRRGQAEGAPGGRRAAGGRARCRAEGPSDSAGVRGAPGRSRDPAGLGPRRPRRGHSPSPPHMPGPKPQPTRPHSPATTEPKWKCPHFRREGPAAAEPMDTAQGANKHVPASADDTHGAPVPPGGGWAGPRCRAWAPACGRS